MSVCILMNNKNKFVVEGTLEDWIEKIKNDQVFEVSSTTYIVSQNISEVSLYEETVIEKPVNDSEKKKSKGKLKKKSKKK